MHKLLKQSGELDTKLKNNEISFVKSFRFKIVLYSLLSLLYTILSEAAIIILARMVCYFIRDIQGKPIGLTRAEEMKQQLNGAVVNGSVNYLNKIDPQMGKPMIGLFVFFVTLIGIALFIFYFLLLTKKFSIYLKRIVNGINQIATGDLSTRIIIDDKDEFAFIADCLNKMADDINILIESERKNEKAKNDLITNVAHDLRTPLTSIIGYLNLTIKSENLDEETRKKYISVAYEKSLRLEKLIGDLFSYTKYSSEEVVAKSMPIDMVKFMEQMVEEFYPALEDAKLEYEFSHNCENAVVIGDGDLLARAFSNLIGNAIKYGRDGKNLRIFVNKNYSYVSVSIVNYGEVIPEADLDYIFDRFYRVENSRSTETGGTGLGLAIAKKIIMMHDGTIKASSSLEGTTFEVILKLADEQ
ncbi:HAMP domain-containing histidine kinase [Lachnospiraceae bacterium WCA-693-APC-MOT-I]|uniref:histidine kinase n=1 Tax=Velocimicrobium porci TaxID=2606634 RepID=A0A6L5XW02_9FIRM|nr:HAMP domain-containing histidine kinase [Velocimicrobium porci]